MSTTTTQRAIDLMPQLRDILQLPEDLRLPKLAQAQIEASSDSPGWTASAQLGYLSTDPERWEALRAWGSMQIPELSDPYEYGGTAPGSWRKASVTVVVAEVSVTVWTHVDGEFVPPEQVHVTGEAAALLIGGDAR